ncbi:hypothetical protein T310_6308, partial [Rasamsonia emersonii CBS 393.64]
YRYWSESTAGMHCLCYCYSVRSTQRLTSSGKDEHQRAGTTASNLQPTNRGTWRAEQFVSKFPRLLAGKDWPKLCEYGVGWRATLVMDSNSWPS